MKILFISVYKFDEFTYKGGGWVSALSSALSQSGEYEVGIVYPSTKTTENWEEDGIKFYPVNAKESRLEYYTGRLLRKPQVIRDDERIKGVIDEFNPEIIQIFGIETTFGGIVRHVKNIPIVVHVQGVTLPYHAAWFPRGVSGHWIRWHSTLRSILFRTTSTDNRISFGYRVKEELLNFKTYKYYLGRTDWDKALVSLYSPSSRYFVCNELLRQPFYFKRWTPVASNLTLMTVSNGELYKGFDVILQCAHLLKESGVKFTWNVYGSTEKDEYIHLMEKYYHLKFRDNNVVFRGKQDADVIADALSKTSFYIHPSHADNSPNAVCEAMLVGVPVISSSVGGVSTLIVNNKSGFLFSDGDFNYLAALINSLKDKHDLLKEISENSANVARKRHAIQNILKELSYAYSHIIEDFENQHNEQKENLLCI